MPEASSARNMSPQGDESKLPGEGRSLRTKNNRVMNRGRAGVSQRPRGLQLMGSRSKRGVAEGSGAMDQGHQATAQPTPGACRRCPGCSYLPD